MKPEAQQIAIAEGCGWKMDANGWINPKGQRSEYNEVLDVSYRAVPVPPPDYLKDLNAMHEAEKTLTQEQQSTYYREALKVVTGSGMFSIMHQNTRAIVSATAEQRAEAFLRAIGKWVDE